MKYLKFYLPLFIVIFGAAFLLAWRYSELQRGPYYRESGRAFITETLIPAIHAEDYEALSGFIEPGAVADTDISLAEYFGYYPSWGRHRQSEIERVSMNERGFFALGEPVVIRYTLATEFTNYSTSTTVELERAGEQWRISHFEMLVPAM